MTLEELATEQRELGSQIQKLIREFERKYSCYAQIRQDSTQVIHSRTPRTLVVELEVHL